MIRRIFSVLALGLTLAAHAQTFPSKAVRIITPFPVGSGPEGVARLVADKLSKTWGQPVTVENRPGGNGVIGADAVAKAPADGYTLLFNASTFTTAPMTMKQVPYSVEKDFAPVALMASVPLILAANPPVHVRSGDTSKFAFLQKYSVAAAAAVGAFPAIVKTLVVAVPMVMLGVLPTVVQSSTSSVSMVSADTQSGSIVSVSAACVDVAACTPTPSPVTSQYCLVGR